MKRYRVATLGAGPRGKDHALAFAASPDRFELLGWCDRDMPHLPGSNSYWLDAGVRVIGTEGWAHAIVGHGWQAVTRDSGGLIGSSEVSFRQTEDTFPYMRLLADWLDDEKKVHPCCGPVTYHGFEISMGILVSALEGSAVTPPVDATVPVFERLKQELPPSPSLEELGK
jgi:hypothetical protein